MNDHGQEQQPTEEQLGKGYTPFVKEGDIPEENSDEEWNHFHYPKKQISNIGLVGITLSRVRPDNPELKEYKEVITVIDQTGVRKMTEAESVIHEYYRLYMKIENPLIRRRGVDAKVYMATSDKPDIYAADLYNDSEDSEEFLKYIGRDGNVQGTELTSENWRDIKTGEKLGEIAVPNDPDFLSTLGFRFEFIQPEVSN